MAPKAGLLLPRTPIVALTGITAVVITTVGYAYEQRSFTIVTQGDTAHYVFIATLYLLVLVASIGLVAIDLNRIVSQRITSVRGQGFAPTTPGWLLPYVVSLKKYRRCFVASTVCYGLLYALITSMIVYQPTVDFGRAYGVAVPSAILTPCCGAPLYTPVLTVYIADHLGLLIIPLTLLLLITISVLVGLNLSISVFAFDSRGKGGSKGVAGILGAVVGLFTGCPTCAGLFFANALGGSGAASFATLLGYYQPAFILLSLPVLLVTPYLTSRSLAKVFTDGCVHIKSGGS